MDTVGLDPGLGASSRENLPRETRVSLITQNSYREMLALPLQFASRRAGVDIDHLSFNALAPGMVRAFLDQLGRERGCSMVTRNQRRKSCIPWRIFSPREPVLTSGTG